MVESATVRPPRWIRGPLPALPELLDRVSERWWSLGPRTRLVAIVAAAVALPLVVVGARGASPVLVEVLVATRDLPAGAALDAGDFTRKRRDPSDRPPAAVTSVPRGAQTAVLIPEGTVITSHHLSEHGPASTIPQGRVAAAIAADRLPAGLRAGQRLDLLAGGPDGTGQVVASDARVLANDGDHVWIEMSAEEAARVVGAATWGPLGVGLLPPG